MIEQKVEFYNDRNQKIVGLLALPFVNDAVKPPIVIIVHGFKGAKEYYPFVNNSIKSLIEADIAVLRIDCRGSGESDMEFEKVTMESEAEDVLTAIEYVKTRKDLDISRIGLIGISMGAAAIMIAMRKKPKVKTLIFWGPAFIGDHYFDTPENRTSIEKDGVFYVTARFTGKKLTAGKKLFEEFITLDVRPLTKFVDVSVLILRGEKEDVAEIGVDREVAKLLKADYWIIKNGDHNFTDKNSEKELIQITAGWLKKQLI